MDHIDEPFAGCTCGAEVNYAEKFCRNGHIQVWMQNPRRQVGGDHYLKHSNMQPFDIIDEYNLNFYEGCALKYLLRWRDKDNVLDLEKAKHYIEILIQKERSPGEGDLPAPGSFHVTSEPEAPTG